MREDIRHHGEPIAHPSYTERDLSVRPNRWRFPEAVGKLRPTWREERHSSARTVDVSETPAVFVVADERWVRRKSLVRAHSAKSQAEAQRGSPARSLERLHVAIDWLLTHCLLGGKRQRAVNQV